MNGELSMMRQASADCESALKNQADSALFYKQIIFAEKWLHALSEVQRQIQLKGDMRMIRMFSLAPLLVTLLSTYNSYLAVGIMCG
jgi:hypothetical protein